MYAQELKQSIKPIRFDEHKLVWSRDRGVPPMVKSSLVEYNTNFQTGEAHQKGANFTQYSFRPSRIWTGTFFNSSSNFHYTPEKFMLRKIPVGKQVLNRVTLVYLGGSRRVNFDITS